MAKASGMFPEGKAGRAGPGGMPRQELCLGGGEGPKERWGLRSPCKRATVPSTPPSRCPLAADSARSCRTHRVAHRQTHGPTSSRGAGVRPTAVPGAESVLGGEAPVAGLGTPEQASLPKSSPLHAGPPWEGGRGRPRAASNLSPLRTGGDTLTSHLLGHERSGKRGPRPKREKGTM